ncbi:MAG TPA: histidine kinase dimerization/phosphoacceptor domain -containing protein [Anaeromyxobacteraceae bacterium]
MGDKTQSGTSWSAAPLPGVSADIFYAVVEAMPAGILMVDGRGLIALVNAQIEALFGYSRKELVHHPVEMLLPDRFRAGHTSLRTAFHGAPQARPMGAGRDLFGRRKDGTEVPVEIGLNPIATGLGTYVLATVVDITERRRAAARLESSLREKETLLREVHHRVKNNLQVISSLLGMQARAVVSNRAALSESQDRVHAIALAHELLYQAGDLGRVDLGAYLEALAHQLLAAWAPPGGGVSLRVEAEEARMPLDVAVPCGLIVSELVTNALKHAFPGGRGTVVVRTACEAGGRVAVSVSDDGVGIPPGESEDRAGHLGLDLVRTLARQLRANLAVTGPPGTTVRLDFEVSA